VGTGAQYLPGSVSRIGPGLWIDVGRLRRSAGLALRKRGNGAAAERGNTLCGG